MKRLYHANTEVFFPNPYVMRISYSREMTQTQVESKHRDLTRRTYKLFKGTWGHSPVVGETLHTSIDSSVHPLSPATLLSALFTDIGFEYRTYFCFKDELDTLQFKLSVDSSAIRVHMWPSETKFIIHEVVEDES